MTTTGGLAQITTVATHTALTAWSFVGDFLIVIAIFLIFVLFARYAGRGPFVALLLAFYSAYALYAVFPYLSYLPITGAVSTLLAHIGLYVLLTFIFYVILRRVIVSDFLYIGAFALIILSFLGAGFIMTLAYHVFPVAPVYHFTPAIDMLFAPKQYFFLWCIAPAIGLLFLAR